MTILNKVNMDYLIGIPSGQIIDIHYKEVNNLKQEGLIAMNFVYNAYTFDDDDYLKILQYLKRPRYSKNYMDDILEFFDHQKHVRNYVLSSDGGVDVSGSIFVASFPDKKIPYKFKRVSGDFIFRDSKIESLEGCPGEVGGNFIISGNNLFDLIGGPTYVGELYDCSSNCINSLEGAPEKIHTDFDCHDNFLTDLKGGPKNVRGVMDCSGNPLKNTDGAPYTCGNLITNTKTKKLSKFSEFGIYNKKMVSDGDGKYRW